MESIAVEGRHTRCDSHLDNKQIRTENRSQAAISCAQASAKPFSPSYNIWLSDRNRAQLLKKVFRVKQFRASVPDGPRRLLNLGVCQEVVVFIVVPATNHKHHCLTERCPLSRNLSVCPDLVKHMSDTRNHSGSKVSLPWGPGRGNSHPPC